VQADKVCKIELLRVMLKVEYLSVRTCDAFNKAPRARFECVVLVTVHDLVYEDAYDLLPCTVLAVDDVI
jgi:hypothetical protein